MRIGIDASCWANKRGYGRYTRELVRALLEADNRNQYTLFLDSATEELCPDLPANAARVVVPTSAAASDAASAAGHRSVRDLWAMSRAVSRHAGDLDLFYFPAVYTFFPVTRRLNSLVTIHDTIAEQHPALIFPHWHNRLFWNAKVAWAIRQARLILTVSTTAQSAVQGRFGLSDERIRVIPDAVGPAFRPADDEAETRRILGAHGLEPGQRFLLYVGGISPHKNIESLIDAFCLLLREDANRDLRLVLVGDYERDVFYSSYDTLRQRVATMLPDGQDSKKVTFTGFVPDGDLHHWYSAAQALVLPSVDEGFGLPAIEAMACGTAVVASRAGALPEVVGDAGVLFEPGGVPALASALRQLLADDSLRTTLVAAGTTRAAQFSWRASARTAIEIFESMGQSQSA